MKENTEESMSEQVNTGSIPDAELKAKYGNVITLSVPKDDAGTSFVYAYLKKPDRFVLAEALSKISADGKGMYEAANGIFDRCLIREISDKMILEDDEMYVSAVLMCQGAVKLHIGEIKKNY